MNEQIMSKHIRIIAFASFRGPCLAAGCELVRRNAGAHHLADIPWPGHVLPAQVKVRASWPLLGDLVETQGAASLAVAFENG